MKTSSRQRNVKRSQSKRDYKGDSNKSSHVKDETKELQGYNDFNWYNLNKSLTSMCAKLPFGRPLGNTITTEIVEVKDVVGLTSPESYTIPGIASFKMVPSIGCSTSGVQTIDVAAKSIYSWVRHANSGHANYDSPDLMIYLLAAQNIYAAAGFLLKTYACLNSYSPTNRYMPKALLTAMEWDADMLVEHIADFRYFCAQWFKKAQVIYTPKKFPLFEKAFWMYTQLFEEDKTGKSPLYQYIPGGFYQYNATKYSSGGCLEFKQPIPVLLQTWSGVLAYFNNLIDVVIDDEDMGIMSGDIKKAFGDDVWSLGEFPFDASIQVVRDSFVLQQMHNTTPLNIDRTKMDIVQDAGTNSLLCFPEIKCVSDANNSVFMFNVYNAVIDIDSEVPSEEEVIEATQYTNFVKACAGISSSRYTSYLAITGYTHAANSFTVTNASDYICREVVVNYFDASGTLQVDKYAMGEYLGADYQSMNKDAMFRLFARLRTLEWLPEIKMAGGLSYTSIHNYTVVRPETIANIHDCSWLSLLAIPANEHLK